MIKTVSKKTYICSLCNEERKGNANSHRTILCWRCVSQLLNTPLDKINQLIAVYEQRGEEELTKLLEHFSDWEQVTERRREIEREWELKKEEVCHEEAGRTMDRGRNDKEVFFTRKTRQKQGYKRMDSQRNEAYRNIRQEAVSRGRYR